jgi:hypothetical protein
VVAYRLRRERMPPTALSAQGSDLPLTYPDKEERSDQQTMEGEKQTRARRSKRGRSCTGTLGEGGEDASQVSVRSKVGPVLGMIQNVPAEETR